MLSCDANEHCQKKTNKKKTGTTIGLISELSFPPHRAGVLLNKVLYWETASWSSNPLPFCVPFLTKEVALVGQKVRNTDRARMYTKSSDSEVHI